MHKFLAFLLFFLALSATAYDHAYEVSGKDEFGRPLKGLAFSNDNQLAVTGEITDAYGDIVAFHGKWVNQTDIHAQTPDHVGLYLMVD